MCYFVTVGVPDRHRQRVEALGKARDGFKVEPAENPHLVRHFPPGDALFTLTHGGCSCDFYAAPTSTTAEEDEAATRSRYRRKGWSEAKIARALESKRRTGGASGRDNHRAKFCVAVTELVQAVGPVRLFAHNYSGRVDTEDVGVVEKLTITIQTFKQQEGAFTPDTVVTLERG